MIVESRIKELRWKNEFYLKRWFGNRETYQPREIDLDAKINVHSMGARIIKGFSICVVLLLGATLYFQKGEITALSFYQLLLAGSVFYLIGYQNQLKASRLEEIRSLSRLQERKE